MGEEALNRRVSQLLLQLGMPPHIKGYRYAKEAIKEAVKNPNLIDHLTKHLYPNVAKTCEATVSKVERGIRHAIDYAWLRVGAVELNKLLKICVYDKNYRPTNGEFIAVIADYILFETVI